MNGIRKAALLTSMDRYATLIVNFISVMCLSRLLTPAEIGVVAIGAAILAFSEATRDVATSYIIQKPDLDRSDLRTSTTLMWIVSLIAIAIINLLAGPMAQFVGDDRVETLMRLISVSLLAAPIERPILAMMRRDMDFLPLAIINAASAVTIAGASIVLAYFGWGPASFGWGCILGGIVVSIAAVALRARYLALRPCLKDARSQLTFALYGNSSGILFQLHEAFPSIMIGRFLSVEAVGIYNRSLTASQLPAKGILAAISPVVLPAFSKQAREGGDLLQPSLRMFELLSAVMWPAQIMVALLATPVVAVLFGSQWTAAIPFVQLIALASLPAFIMHATHAVMVAAGGVRHTTISLMKFVPLSLAITALSAYHSLEAFCVALFLVYALQAYFAIDALKHYVEIRFVDLAGACARSLPAVGASVAGACLVALPMAGGFAKLSVLQGFFAGISAVAFWLLALWLSRHPLWHEVRHLADMLRAKRTPRPVA